MSCYGKSTGTQPHNGRRILGSAVTERNRRCDFCAL
jgi:hypothetical protein